MSSDPFSDLLRLTEAKSVASGGFRAGGTWAIHVPAGEEIVFSAMARGSCWLRLDHERNGVELTQGEVGLLAPRRGFFLGSSLKVTPTEAIPSDMGGRIDTIGTGADCTLLWGRVSLPASSQALLGGVLPASVRVGASSRAAAEIRSLIECLLLEQTEARPGSSAASEKLAELLFVQIVRAHAMSSPALPPGWLRATTDERLVRALRAIHEQPSRDWSVSDLADVAGMSRTRFAVHFRSIAGITPLGYLAEWRMRLAQRTLRDTDESIAALAESLGYASESAFSNAFKRVVGVAPRHYRLTTRRGPSAA